MNQSVVSTKAILRIMRLKIGFALKRVSALGTTSTWNVMRIVPVQMAFLRPILFYGSSFAGRPASNRIIGPLRPVRKSWCTSILNSSRQKILDMWGSMFTYSFTTQIAVLFFIILLRSVLSKVPRDWPSILLLDSLSYLKHISRISRWKVPCLFVFKLRSTSVKVTVVSVTAHLRFSSERACRLSLTRCSKNASFPLYLILHSAAFRFFFCVSILRVQIAFFSLFYCDMLKVVFFTTYTSRYKVSEMRTSW